MQVVQLTEMINDSTLVKFVIKKYRFASAQNRLLSLSRFIH